MTELSAVHVKLTGDASGLKAALDGTQDELKETERSSEKTKDSLRGLAKGLASVAAAAVGIKGMSSLFSGVVREAEKFETSMLKINAIIRATGGVAGKTGDQILSFAQSLALNTLESTEGVLAAQQRLLTFRKVSGDVFDRAIRASADLSAAMGTDLSSSAVMLGRALEDPITGLTSLTRTGTVFTDAQKDLVKSLVQSGNLQQAQILILKELEAQYGGTAQAAATGYAGALDTLAQRQQELFLAIDDTLGVTKGLAAAAKGLANVFDALARNMQRIVSYIATAAVAGMIAFRGVIIGAAAAITRLLIPSLAGLRVALMRTGIGAIIVLAGELVYQVTRVVSRLGGMGNAISAVGDLAEAFLTDIREGFKSFSLSIDAAAAGFKASFMDAFSSVAARLSVFLSNLARAVGGIPGAEAFADRLEQSAGRAATAMVDFGAQADFARQRSNRLAAEAADAANGFDKTRTALEALAETMRNQPDDDDPPQIPGMPSNEDPSGGGDGGTSYIEEQLERQRQAVQEFHNRIRMIQSGNLGLQLQGWSGYFSNLSSMIGNRSKKIAQVAKVFDAMMALRNSYVAYTEALREPGLPPLMRLGYAASVFAAGLGAVSAIQGIGAGGGGAAPSGSPAMSAAAAPAPVSRNVAISLQGGDMFSRDQVVQLINSINEAVEDGAIVRLV